MRKKVEISIREIVIFSLSKWWIILLSIILVGGVYIWSSQRTHEASVKSIMRTYEKSVAEYELNEAKNKKLLDETIKKRDDLAEYMNSSVLMRVLPQQVKQAILNVGVIGDELIYAEQRTIVDHYLAFAQEADLSALFGDKNSAKISNRYLNEMVSLSRGQSNLFSISVKGDKDTDTEYLARALYDYLLSRKVEVIQNTGLDHTLKLISFSNEFIVDAAIRSQQTVDQRNLEGFENRLAGLRASEPVPPTLPNNNLAKNAIIGLLLGAVIGAFLCLLLYICVFTLQYVFQLQEQLKIRFLGNVRAAKKRSLIVDGNTKRQNIEQAYDFTVANLDEAIDNHKRILITGTADANDMAHFTQKIEHIYSQRGITITHGGNILQNAATIRLLSEADAVVIVESLQHSKVRQINALKERLKESGRPVLGYVII